jgi:putative DNA primase/helicase
MSAARKPTPVAPAPSPPTPTPTYEEARPFLEHASVDPAACKTTPEKLARINAAAWLIEHGLASEWPPPKPGKVPEPYTPGNPTPKHLRYIAEQHAAEKPRPKAFVVRLDQEVRSDPEWLWPGRLPSKRVSLVMGRQGDGKSTFSSWLCAVVTSGLPWPDDPVRFARAPGSVVILQAEEIGGEDILPRVEAMGGDPARVHQLKWVIQGEGVETGFVIGRDCQVLADLCEEIGDVKLVIIDPVKSFVGGTKGNNDGEVREFMGPLFRLTERFSFATVLIAHPNKDAEKEVLDRVSGSGAYSQMARSVWYFSEDPADPSRRMLSLMKGNVRGLTRTAISFGYNEERMTVDWDATPVKLTAQNVDSLLQRAMRTAKVPSSPRGPAPAKTSDATNLILDLLGGGPLLLTQVQALVMDRAGIGESTFRRALRSLLDADGRVVRRKDEASHRFYLSLSGDSRPCTNLRQESLTGAVSEAVDPLADPETAPVGRKSLHDNV